MTEKKETKKVDNALLAVIRIRGGINTERKIKSTLELLRLHKVNHCVIIPKKPELEGMAKRAAGYVTWGDVSNEMIEKMVYKRGRLVKDKRVDKKDVKDIAKKILDGKETGIKPVFRLNPPSKGFKNTRLLYPRGALGYRGEKINELLKRMI
ncbi:MAG: 50S ribosomal protein L30 [Nanoarchaeota archaeon]|nr:50S ribosomal protein L30 [Nanoarchaeota archaeon]